MTAVFHHRSLVSVILIRHAYRGCGLPATPPEPVAQTDPVAVYLPSGTMAQQSALRVHADRRGRRTVVFHPECHLDRHEGRALERVQGLVGRPAGDPDRLLGLSDLAAVAEAPAA